MRAAFLQYNPSYLDVVSNLDEAAELLYDVDADLVVLPELFASGYFFRSLEDLARVAEEADGGPTIRRLVEWASRDGAVYVAGFPEVENGTYYNSAVVAGADGVIGFYRKVHLFHREKALFTTGDLGFPVFQLRTREGVEYRLGVMICFDWYYPEAARLLALQGADIIAHPSNLVRRDCPRAMPIRALENHVFTITANRVGTEAAHGEELTFIGQSLICDPEGETIVSASVDGVETGRAEIDPLVARDRQLTEFNDLLRDRRPETYGALVS